jgi:glutamate N-acetyltransferase/amino-acid N-acetyltransferase
MAIGKSNVDINLNKLSIKFGDLIIVNKGKISNQYNENEAAKYMKGLDINIGVDIGNGKKSFTVYTMDLTDEYIKINSDYRS